MIIEDEIERLEKRLRCQYCLGKVSKKSRKLASTLNVRQKQQTCSSSNTATWCYNKIFLSAGYISVGDYVEMDGKVGSVEKIFSIDNCDWLDVSFFNRVKTNQENNLRHAASDDRVLNMVKVEANGVKPIVAAIAGPVTWFLTPTSLDFYWLQDHISVL